MSRNALVETFLRATGHADWQRLTLAGDASARRYLRLVGPQGSTVILMVAPPGPAGAVAPFLRIAAHLREAGLSAPGVLAADPDQSLVLLEDLGPDHFGQWLDRHPGDAALLYDAALDCLIRAQSVPPPPGLVALTPDHAAAMIAPLTEHYAPAVGDHLIGPLREALARYAPEATRFAFRDYHAENLIWRPGHSGLSRVGLLDFQDAVLAPDCYDLVSLLRDARREIDPVLAQTLMQRFARLLGRPEAEVSAACAALGVQRNLRILGIFARLARVEGKMRYLALLPRVWAHLRADLDHPALAALRGPALRLIPAPEGSHLRGLGAA